MTTIGSLLRPWLLPQSDTAVEREGSGGRLREQVAGPDADRILLAIDRPAVKRSPNHQDPSFLRHLARHLSLLSGRGVDLDILDGSNLTLAKCAAALASLNLARFDAIALMVGSSEALSLVPARSWIAELTMLLDDIEDASPHSVHTFVVEVPSARALTDIPTVFTPVVEASIRRLNLATRSVCAGRTRASSLAFDIPVAARTKRPPQADSEFCATLIAPAIVHRLAPVTNPLDSERPE